MPARPRATSPSALGQIPPLLYGLAIDYLLTRFVDRVSDIPVLGAKVERVSLMNLIADAVQTEILGQSWKPVLGKKLPI